MRKNMNTMSITYIWSQTITSLQNWHTAAFVSAAKKRACIITSFSVTHDLLSIASGHANNHARFPLNFNNEISQLFFLCWKKLRDRLRCDNNGFR